MFKYIEKKRIRYNQIGTFNRVNDLTFQCFKTDIVFSLELCGRDKCPKS